MPQEVATCLQHDGVCWWNKKNLKTLETVQSSRLL